MKNYPVKYVGDSLRINNEKKLQKNIITFLDTISTNTGKKTFYNTEEEQQKALQNIHNEMMSMNRGLYLALLCVSGSNDRNVQLGIGTLLRTPYRTVNGSILTEEIEFNGLEFLVDSLPPQRVLKLFCQFPDIKLNNSRTKKLVLNYILKSNNLEYWSVKYRNKLKKCLTHIWGLRTSSIIVSILNKKNRNEKENKILDKHLYKYIRDSKISNILIENCILFIFGNEKHANKSGSKFLESFVNAKKNFKDGKELPFEVLEGLRSTFHKDVPHEKVLLLTKNNLTSNQKISMHKKAKESNVKLQVKTENVDIVKLYISALENPDDDFTDSLSRKVKKEFNNIPFEYENISIVFDNSKSMFGDVVSGKNKPIAISLAMRDMLIEKSEESSIYYSSGGDYDQFELCYPKGETDLALPLAKAINSESDAIFIITDGYENAPAGRVDEILEISRELGFNKPVYQITPVASAEAQKLNTGVRSLSDHVSKLPVNNPASLGVGSLRMLIENDIEQAVIKLIKMANKKLLGDK